MRYLSKTKVKQHLLLLLFLLLVVAVPMATIDAVRYRVITWATPLFKRTSFLAKGKAQAVHKQLEAENHLLHLEIQKLKAALEQKGVMEMMLGEKSGLLDNCVLSAQVLYRDPLSFLNALWINVGEETNARMKKQLVCKNSPVLLGCSVVGAIDYVGKKASRVRLLTDPLLKISVRTARGTVQNTALLFHAEALLRSLAARKELMDSQSDAVALAKGLFLLKKHLCEKGEGWYLAKGTMEGGSAPFKGRVVLKGSGFNYDFPDATGGARDLLTGALRSSDGKEGIPLVKIDDQLVTTGMDGVFPPGLHVGAVTKILPLKEGDCAYTIEASPAAGHLSDLTYLFVIPPIESQECE